MKLTFYMLKRFFSIFIGSMFFFVLILLLTDLLMNIWGYMSNDASVQTVGMICLYYIPKCVWYAVPMAVLFSTAYMLSDFYAKNELLAVFASGISLYKFTIPLIVIAGIMSVALFQLDDKLVARTYAKKQDLQQVALNRTESYNNSEIVVLSEGGKMIYKAAFFDGNQNRLYSLYVLYRDNEKKFDGLLYAESAMWNYDHWDLSNSVFYHKDGSKYSADDIDYDHRFRLTEAPVSFRKNIVNIEEVSAADARDYIRRLEKAGLPSSEAKAVYYKKFAFPFVVLVVVLLAIGLSGKTRKNVLIISLALSITAVVIFYVMQMITMLMARFGTIPPVFGEWFPVIFFIFLSILLLKYTRT